MSNRDIEAEWRHLWRWARGVSVLRDLPEELHWNADDGLLELREPNRRVGFDVEVIRTPRSRREIATIRVEWFDGGTAIEEMAVPAGISAAASGAVE